jgi:hypothetical protein
VLNDSSNTLQETFKVIAEPSNMPLPTRELKKRQPTLVTALLSSIIDHWPTKMTMFENGSVASAILSVKASAYSDTTESIILHWSFIVPFSSRPNRSK